MDDLFAKPPPTSPVKYTEFVEPPATDPPSPTQGVGPVAAAPQPWQTPPRPPSARIGKLEPQYTTAYQAWKTEATPENRTALLQQVRPVLDMAARSYGADSPVMRGRGKLMAVKALDTYDPSRGTLKTHLLSQLASLQRASAHASNVVHVPEQIALDRAMLQRTALELEDALGRPPNDEELADKTMLSMKRIAYVRRYKPPVASSQIRARDEETGQMEEIDIPTGSLTKVKAEDDPWVQFVYSDLSPTDKLVMDLSLGLHGSPVVQSKEIARRLGVTPGAVSLRAAKIQKLLDERSEHNLF